MIETFSVKEKDSCFTILARVTGIGLASLAFLALAIPSLGLSLGLGLYCLYKGDQLTQEQKAQNKLYRNNLINREFDKETPPISQQKQENALIDAEREINALPKEEKTAPLKIDSPCSLSSPCDNASSKKIEQAPIPQKEEKHVEKQQAALPSFGIWSPNLTSCAVGASVMALFNIRHLFENLEIEGIPLFKTILIMEMYRTYSSLCCTV